MGLARGGESAMIADPFRLQGRALSLLSLFHRIPVAFPALLKKLRRENLAEVQKTPIGYGRQEGARLSSSQEGVYEARSKVFAAGGCQRSQHVDQLHVGVRNQ
jgi:hypothetical protein